MKCKRCPCWSLPEGRKEESNCGQSKIISIEWSGVVGQSLDGFDAKLYLDYTDHDARSCLFGEQGGVEEADPVMIVGEWIK